LNGLVVDDGVALAVAVVLVLVVVVVVLAAPPAGLNENPPVLAGVVVEVAVDVPDKAAPNHNGIGSAVDLAVAAVAEDSVELGFVVVSAMEASDGEGVTGSLNTPVPGVEDWDKDGSWPKLNLGSSVVVSAGLAESPLGPDGSAASPLVVLVRTAAGLANLKSKPAPLLPVLVLAAPLANKLLPNCGLSGVIVIDEAVCSVVVEPKENLPGASNLIGAAVAAAAVNPNFIVELTGGKGNDEETVVVVVVVVVVVAAEPGLAV
jgi:hypothetical protein